MNRFLQYFIIIVFSFLSVFCRAQDNSVKEKKPDNRPVLSTFECSMLIENQSIINPRAGIYELIIYHRFGKIDNGTIDLFGIYAPSNIRLSLVYGINNKLSIGFGTEKNNKLQDISLKWSIIQQTRSNNTPLSVAYFGNMAIDARNSEVFGENYTFTHRFSYFHQFIIARKFNRQLSLQIAPSYSHFNSVDTLYEHDKISLHFGGRYILWGDNSLILEYDIPMAIKFIQRHDMSTNKSKANMSFGFELGTGTHAFQVFITTFDNIVYQKNYLYNRNDFLNNDLLLGFNILVRL